MGRDLSLQLIASSVELDLDLHDSNYFGLQHRRSPSQRALPTERRYNKNVGLLYAPMLPSRV